MPTRIEDAAKFNKHKAIRQKLRVEFTLTKLQEDLSEQESSRQITLAHKIIKITKSSWNRRHLISDKISQADQHAKALQKSSKLKTSSGSRLYGKHFKQIWTTSTIFLKDERVLSSILHSLSCTSQLKIQKLCHHPTKAIKMPTT